MMEPTTPEKILISMYVLSKSTTGPCRYEDIVVKAFEMFPKDFQLRGYPHFPDSSDIHKPLYGPLKRGGLIRAANKTFRLTDKGLARAKEIFENQKNHNRPEAGAAERFTRDMETELTRLRKSAALQLYADGKTDRILDTDFYSYLGVTVRTGRNDFLGRLNAVSDTVETAAKLDPEPINIALLELHRLLLTTFESLIRDKTESGK